MAGLRVLIMAADHGAGHLVTARSLTDQLAERHDVEVKLVSDDLAALGPRADLMQSRLLPRRVRALVGAAVAHRELAGTIGAVPGEVLITVSPVLSATLGQLRLLGRFPLPLVAVVPDGADARSWAARGVDMHLVSSPEARDEVEAFSGPGTATIIRPLVDPRFLDAPARGSARGWVARQLQLSLKGGRPLVLLANGGADAGDLAGAVEVTVERNPEAAIVVLAGEDADTAARLGEQFAGAAQVRVLGVSERMATLLSAADALVHDASDLATARQAQLVGCPVISYGAGSAPGQSECAQTREELGPALARALARARPAPADVSALPGAADVVIATALDPPARPR